MSRYEARRKFGEHERGVRVARVAANSINDNKNYKEVELTNFQICQNHASQRPNYSKWSQLEIRRKLQLEYRFNVKLTFYSQHKSHQLQITFICSFQRLSTYSVWFCQGQIFKPCIRLLPQITWDDRPSWSSLFEHCLVPLQRLPRPPGPMNFRWRIRDERPGHWFARTTWPEMHKPWGNRGTSHVKPLIRSESLQIIFNEGWKKLLRVSRSKAVQSQIIFNSPFSNLGKTGRMRFP